MKLNSVIAKTLMLPVAVLATHAAAMAQDQVAPAGPESAAAAPAAAAPAAEAAKPAEEGNPQIVAFVDYQFPKADANGDGTVTADEFTAWISGLKSAELEKAGQTPDPAMVKAYADGALRTADKDDNHVVSKAELVKFFGG